MRVISGRWKGRRLKAPPGLELRPTTDRVKEALFSILHGDLAGSSVIDLCCGAGGLGIEALSRGAAQARFVDKAARSLTAVAGNLDLCGADRDSFTLVRQDALTHLGQVLDMPPAGDWLLLADPPYASGIAEGILARAEDLKASPGFVAAVVEHDRGLDVTGLTGGAGSTRRYGRTVLTILRPEVSGGPDE